MPDSSLTLQINGDASGGVSAINTALDAISSLASAIPGLSSLFDSPKESVQAFGDLATQAFTNPVGAIQSFGSAIESGITSVLSDLGPIGVGAAAGLGALGAGAVAAGGLVFDLADKAADAGEQVQAFSEQTGIAVENVGPLQFAANAAGGSLQTLSSIIRQVDLKSATDQGGKFSAALADMGINAKTFNSEDSEAKIMDLAQGMTVASAKGNAMADSLATMGRAGSQNIAFLEKMTPQLLAAGQAMGVIWTPETIEQAETFKVSLGELQQGVDSIGIKIGMKLLPAMSGLLQSFATSPAFIDDVVNATTVLAHGLGDLVDGAGDVTAGILHLGQGFLGGLVYLLEFDEKLYGAEVALGEFVSALGKVDPSLKTVGQSMVQQGTAMQQLAASEIPNLQSKYNALGTAADAVYNLSHQVGSALASVGTASDAAAQKIVTANKAQDAATAADQKRQQAVDQLAQSLLGDSAKEQETQEAIERDIQITGLSTAAKTSLVAAIEKEQKAGVALTASEQAFLDTNSQLTAKQLAYTKSLGDTATKLDDLIAGGMSFKDAADKMGSELTTLSGQGKVLGRTLGPELQTALEQFNADTVTKDIQLFFAKTVASSAAAITALKKNSQDGTAAMIGDYQAYVTTYEQLSNEIQNDDNTALENKLNNIETERDAEQDKINVMKGLTADQLDTLTDMNNQYYDHLDAIAMDSASTIVERMQAAGVQTIDTLQANEAQALSDYQAMVNNENFTDAERAAQFAKYQAAMKAAGDQFAQGFVTEMGTVNSMLGTMASQFSGTMKAIIGDVQNAINSVSNFASSIGSLTTDIATGNWVGVIGDVGSAIGDVVGWIGSLFSSGPDEFQTLSTAIQKFGVSTSYLQDTASSVTLLTGELAQLNGQAPITTTTVNDLFANVVYNSAGAAQATSTLNDAVKTFQSEASTTSGVWSTAFQDLIAQANATGTSLSNLSGIVAGQVTDANNGLTTALGVTSNAYTQLSTDQTTLATDQASLATASTADQQSLQVEIAKTTADIATQQGIISTTQISSQNQADAVGDSIEAVIDANMKAGQSFVQSVEGSSAAISSLQQQLTATGYTGTQAFQFIQQEQALATGAISGPAITAVEGYTQAVTGLANAGGLTQSSFAGLETQIGSTYNSLIAQGNSGAAVMAALQPDLQTAWQMEQQYGYTVDDATQSLINQGVQAGTVGETQESSTQQMIDALNKMSDTLDKIAGDFNGPGGLSDQAQSAATKIQGSLNGITAPDLNFNVNENVTQSVTPPPETNSSGVVIDQNGNPVQGASSTTLPSFDGAPLSLVTDAGMALLHPGDVVGVPGPGQSAALAGGGGGGDNYALTVQISALDADSVNRAMPTTIGPAILSWLQRSSTAKTFLATQVLRSA